MGAGSFPFLGQGLSQVREGPGLPHNPKKKRQFSIGVEKLKKDRVFNPNLSEKDKTLIPETFNEVCDIAIRQLKFRNGMSMKRILFWTFDILAELEANKQVDEKKIKEFTETKTSIEKLLSK